MKRYRVVHRTGFVYTTPVVASYNEVRMLPARDEGQLVFSSKLEIRPHPASHEYQDYFGTRVVMFEVLEHHRELEITSTSTVELRAHTAEVPNLGWDELGAAAARNLALTDALHKSKRTAVPAELAKFAKKQADTLTPHEAALAICDFIHQKMTYQMGETGVHSVATEAWSKKVGVCQDFSHLALGALRSIGIPARYVSGYLHPKPEPALNEKVVGESHAWVEWWAGSWFAADPTNSVPVTDRHIVVARGRDYDDVPPLRGVFAGAAGSELFVSVEITREA
ncbi:MAG: transglutaminase domain-containing protein [Micrococcales bacterium]